MIKSNDLRIGNWVYYTHTAKCPMQVIGLRNNWVSLDFAEKREDEVNPIPLTEKLLERLKFKEYIGTISSDLNLSVYIKNKFLIGLTDEFWLLNQCDNNYYIRKIKYVHELQNAYYVITGKELNIKLEWL
jgi:hypothetical protein